MRAARRFKAVILTGPRRSGKTTLVRRLFPRARYFLLEDPDIIARVRADPRGFLDEINPPVILDEIQNVPELFSYIRTRMDGGGGKRGPWLLTGSQEAPLMKGVTESLAGRAATFHLLPLSCRETSRVSLFRGGFPEVIARPALASVWFRSYIQTYLERDVRAVTAIKNLATFRRFLMLLASRCGGMLNRSDLATPLGVSIPTVSEWLNILEITAQIVLVPPYFENFGKRLVKSPKVYFVDSGLACHLLGMESAAMLEKSPFLGPFLEGWVAAEIMKHQLNCGRARELYYFRDRTGLEVDFLVPGRKQSLILAEIKAARTVRPEDAGPLRHLARAIPGRAVRGFVVHRAPAGGQATHALSPGVSAVNLEEFLDILDG